MRIITEQWSEILKARKVLKFAVSIFIFIVVCIPLILQAQTTSSTKVQKSTSFFIQYIEKEYHSSEEAINLVRKKFNKGSDEQLKAVSIETDGEGNSHQRFQHYYKGIKVEHAIVTAHSKGGRLISVNGNYPDIPALNTSASLTKEEALQKALDIVHAKKYKWEDSSSEARLKKTTSDPNATYYPKVELVICKISAPGNNRNGSYTLAYKMEIYALDPISRTWFYVDANDGSIVMQDEILKHANTTGTAATRYSGTRTINTEQIGSSYYLHDNTRGGGIVTYNLDINNNISDFIDNDDNWSAVEYHDAASDDGALDAHWGGMMTYDYWKNKHNRDSYDGLGSQLIGYMHYGAASNTENAFWSGSEMFYGGTTNPFTSLDICGHEIGHGITQYTTGLVYSFESGALNEGFSDIWGACVEYYADPTKQTWLLGEDVCPPGNYIRSMSNPNARYQPDTYMGTYWYNGYGDNGGVHTNSGVLNFYFYLLSVGGSGTNDNGNNYSVSGITMDKAANISYQARFYLTPTAEYPDARNATIQAAIDLYGAASNEVLQVKNAWYAVGLYDDPMIEPTNLTASAISSTSVLLNWSDTNNPVSNYRIERSTTPNINYVAIDTIASGTTTYIDNTGTTNVVFYYRVRAMSTPLLSPYSNEASVLLGTIPVITMSNTPQTTCDALFMDDGGLNYYSNSETLVSTFTPSTAGASLTVRFSSFETDNKYSSDKLYIYDGANISAPLIGLFNGSMVPKNRNLALKKIIYASATNTTGQLTFRFVSDATSNFPGWVAKIGCITLPALPTQLTATATSATQSSLSWNDNASNETNYMVERSIDFGKTYTQIAALAANSTSYADINLATNAVYYYRIRAMMVIAPDTFYSSYSNIAIDTLGYIPFTALPNTGIPQLLTWGSSMDWGDYDNDGSLDLLITGYSSTYVMNAQVLKNNKNGTFTDINAGFLPIAQGDAIWGDYDNDGDLDVFIGGANANLYYAKIYRNDKGSFTDIQANITGSFLTAAAWGDYDNDGDLDLAFSGYTGNGNSISKIYQNTNGNFTDINAPLVGLYDYYATTRWGDYDNDGDLDLLQVGRNSSSYQMIIYNNNNGSFSQTNSGLPILPTGIPGTSLYLAAASWGDYDNDGDLDVLFTGYNPYSGQNQLGIYKNTGGMHTLVNLGFTGSFPTFGDYDNDGDLDIISSSNTTFTNNTNYVTKIYKNDNGSFSDANSNTLTLVGLSSLADYDNDGDLDFLVLGGDGVTYSSSFFENKLIAGSVPLASNANQVPAAPGNLHSSISGNSVTLNWDKATDAETPQNALTYSLRIGTTSGGNDIMSSSSLANGYRKVVAMGNTQTYNNNGSFSRNCLPSGTYYWSVQAIDNGYEGSAFAAEQSFTISNSGPSLVNLSPTNNAVNVTASTNLIVTFSENIQKGTGFINLRETATDSLVESFNVASSPLLTINNAILTINPTNNLQGGTSYYIEIPTTAFYDLTVCKINYGGTLTKNTWTFTTAGTLQTITFNSLITKTFGDPTFTLTATASSGLPIIYSSTNQNVAVVNGNVVTIVGPGTTTIEASQGGNGIYLPATDVSHTLLVNKAPQTITFNDNLSAINSNSAPFSLHATTTSLLPITYTSSNPAVAVVNGNVVTVIGTGTAVITAIQGGDNDYLPATSKNNNLTISVATAVISGMNVGNYELFPNPSEGIYFIKGDIREGAKVELTNSQGISKEILIGKKDYNLYVVDITTEAAGLYFITITTSDENPLRFKLINFK